MSGFSALYAVRTAASILARGVEIATELALPVTSWRAGDPTRSLYHFLSEVLAEGDGLVSEWIRASALSTASGDWLTVLALEVYGVERVEATAAISSATLSNPTASYYTVDAGDVVVSSSESGATYTSRTGGALAPGGTLVVEVAADAEGSSGSASANEIDTIVSGPRGVLVTASTAAVGVDEQDDPSLRTQCRATLGALSPNGPPDAYEYVARNPALTNTAVVTKAKSSPSSSTGTAILYVAGAAGAVSGGDVALVRAAVERWATPLCITPLVGSASAVSVAITATITGDDIPAGYDSDAAAALAVLIAGLDIGDDVTRSDIISTLQVLAKARGGKNISVVLTAPASDVLISTSQVASIGAVTLTVVS